MIQIDQCRLRIPHTQAQLESKIRKILRLHKNQNISYEIRKRSIDARKKPELSYVYQIWVKVPKERELIRRLSSKEIRLVEPKPYRLPAGLPNTAAHPPVIVGAGPAGLFCAYLMTELGLAPIVCERGRRVEQRREDVERFWQTGVLDTTSNVQFGEGGAGAFSDGKLNTAVKDSTGRIRFVLETFVKFGAPSEILYEQKPHIGTDILARVIANMRQYMTERGCQFCFETVVDDLVIEDGRIRGVRIQQSADTGCGAGSDTVTLPEDTIQEADTADICRILPTDTVVLAIGHSARDTFVRLNELDIPMEAKNFAVGLRVEHPQSMIDEAMYGRQPGLRLPAAPYKLTSNFPNGRGVYSFCMCPGGYVVNAASGTGQTVVNGMSYSGRDGANANSAIIISVTPGDFICQYRPDTASSTVNSFRPDTASSTVNSCIPDMTPPEKISPLAGMYYQQRLEKQAFDLGGGRIPQQLYGDYRDDRISTDYGDFVTAAKGACTFANLRGLFAPELEAAFLGGMEHFARMIPGFDRADTILSGVESRTSSPIRILRGKDMQSLSVAGLYPCGEGAGYAGGITSAAIDGLKTAEAIAAIHSQPHSVANR